MITVPQARAQAQDRLAAHLGRWAGAVAAGAAGGPGDAVLSIALKPPTEQQMLADERAAEAWARSWAAVRLPSGAEIDWTTRAWRSIGRQRVPVRLRLADADAVAAFAGGRAEQDWVWVRGRVARLVEAFGPSDALGAAVRRHVGHLAAFDDVRFAQVLGVARWVATNGVTGYRPRQVPVRGVDSKWLGRHRRLIADLVTVATGSPELGLIDADPLVRLRLLDPRLAVGGLSDLAAPAAQLMRLPLQPGVVLVLENLESLLAMPPAPGVVAVHGSGYAVDVAGALPWVRAAPVLYWGDLDSNGFAILHRLRVGHPRVTSVLMDETTLLDHRDLWVLEPTPARGTYPHLSDGEQTTLARLRAEGDVRLEQERVPWDYAMRSLNASGIDLACGPA